MSTQSLRSSSALLQCLSRPGPSRLARSLPCALCRRTASTNVESEPITPGSPQAETALLGSTPSASESTEQRATNESAGESRPRGGFGGGRNDGRVKPDAPGYENWLKSVGAVYREPPSNGPNWLGKEVPYPSNPSFQPPPPMSDALKELIYSEVYTGGSSSSAILSSLESLSGRPTEKQSADQGAELRKRINRVSEDFGISKKRIEAVLKLKEHERGMKDRGETLQTPFLTAMERYLAVRPIRPKNTANNSRNYAWESQERAFRRNHPSSSLEASEEAAHEAFVGGETARQDSTAFTQRDTIEADRGVERAVWEFRDSELSADKTRPHGTEPLDVPYNRVLSSEQVAQRSDDKDAHRARKSKSHRPVPSVGQKEIKSKLVDLVEVPKAKGKPTIFRFTDVASAPASSGPLMSRVGQGKMQEQTGQREQKARRSERIRKAKAELQARRNGRPQQK